MMGHLGIDMNVTCDKQAILKALRSNREQHAQFVQEARVEYCKQAQTVLEKKLNALKEGKIVQLTFSLRVPKDYTDVYDTVISMLELHTGSDITLSATEYRQLVEDEWSWTSEFAGSNMAYSSSVRDWAGKKGLSVD